MSKSITITRNAKASPSGEGGFTIVEAMIAIAVLAVAAFSALTTLTSSSALDEDLKGRSVALRAAITQMESVMAYDYSDDIGNLVTFFTQPANSTFNVDGLAAPAAGAQGAIVLDTTDPDRILVTVTVRWSTKTGAARALSLQHVMTEVVN